MPKGKKLTCPECGWEYTPELKFEDVWCTGRRTSDSIPHKYAVKMKGKG